jgi:hypothetical protein
MKRFFLLSLALLMPLALTAQTAKTRADLYTEIDSNLASSQPITALMLRNTFKNVVASSANGSTDGAYALYSAIAANNASGVNSDGLVHWTQLVGVPAGFADGLDDTASSGSGDMLKSENLSGLTNYATARTNLGLGNVNNTADTAKPVSTAQQTALDGKQATLISGTNIKTINGVSVLGSGNMVISGGGGGSAAPPLNADWTTSNTNFVVEGDSISWGWGDFSSISALSGKANFYNVAVSGSYIGAVDGSGPGGNVFARYTANVYPRRPAANGGTAGITNSILVLMLGTNNNYDLALSRYATYIATAKSHGFTVIVCTIYVTTGFNDGEGDPYTVQACEWFGQFNLGLNDGTAGADYVIPIDQIFRGIGDPGISGDKLHQTGEGITRSIDAINAFLLSDGTAYSPDATRLKIATTQGTHAGGATRNDMLGDTPRAWRAAQGPAITPLTFAADLVWDTRVSQAAAVTLSADMTSITPANQVSGTSYELWVKHNGHSITWGYPIVFASGVSTTESADTDHTDYYKFVCKDSLLVGVEHLTGIDLNPPPEPGVVMSEGFLQTGASSPGVSLHGTAADIVNISGKTWVVPDYNNPFNFGIVRKHDANEAGSTGNAQALYDTDLTNNYELEVQLIDKGSGSWQSGIVVKAQYDNVVLDMGSGGGNEFVYLNLIENGFGFNVELLHNGGGFAATLFSETAASLGIVNGDILRMTIIDGVFRLYRNSSETPVKTQSLPGSVATYDDVGLRLGSGARYTNFKIRNLAP